MLFLGPLGPLRPQQVVRTDSFYSWKQPISRVHLLRSTASLRCNTRYTSTKRRANVLASRPREQSSTRTVVLYAIYPSSPSTELCPRSPVLRCTASVFSPIGNHDPVSSRAINTASPPSAHRIRPSTLIDPATLSYEYRESASTHFPSHHWPEAFHSDYRHRSLIHH